MLDDRIYENYISILQEELVLATGCTEPIAIAYCAAKMRALLGRLPDEVSATVSGNILKNVKSVVVPNTGGQKGIQPAIAVGIVAGDAEKELQVIADVTEAQQPAITAFLQSVPIHVACGQSPCLLDIQITGTTNDGHSACVRITNNHTNIVYLAKDGEVLLEQPVVDAADEHLTDKRCLNVEDIIRFADTVPIERITPVLERQVQYNAAIAEEGLRGNWGAQIGKILREDYGDDIKQEAKAWAAAGSDARMSGCEMPVVILSGSGNQGITASMPVYRYAERIGATKEQLLPGPGGLRPYHHPSKDRHRPPLCVLRRHFRRRRRGRRHLLPAGRRLHCCGTYRRQRRGDPLRYDLRRRKALVRSQNRRCGGRRDHGLPDVSASPGIPAGRRHRRRRGRQHHCQHRHPGQRRHAANRPNHSKYYDGPAARMTAKAARCISAARRFCIFSI